MFYKSKFNKENIEKKCVSKSFTELLETFNKEGCPICSLNYSNINSYFSSILYECVNDPTVRRKLRNSLGYCKYHSVQFIQFVKSSYNRFGASIMVEDIVKEIIKELDRFSKLSLKDLKKIKAIKHNCPACIYQKSYEDIYYSEILNKLEDKDFFNKFLESDGFCLNHLLGLIKNIKDPLIRNKIIENQKGKFITVSNDLNNFVKKHSGQNNEKITLNEAEAFSKGIKQIVGD